MCKLPHRNRNSVVHGTLQVQYQDPYTHNPGRLGAEGYWWDDDLARVLGRLYPRYRHRGHSTGGSGFHSKLRVACGVNMSGETCPPHQLTVDE